MSSSNEYDPPTVRGQPQQDSWQSQYITNRKVPARQNTTQGYAFIRIMVAQFDGQSENSNYSEEVK